jgi:Ca2+-transporting ATPase
MANDATAGLSSQEAERRLAEHGPNELPAAPPDPVWLRFLRQFRSPLIYILLFAVAFDVGDWFYDRFEGWPVEGAVIAFILVLNAALGTAQEVRSEQAIAQLRKLTTPFAWVARDGRLVQVPNRALVPGDVVRIEAGERLPTDGEVVDGIGITSDESVLTGESAPVEKPIGAELHGGTLVVRGKGAFRVSRTGPRSAMGRIAASLGAIPLERTPLERQLDALGVQIARWISVLAVLLVIGGTLTEGVRRLDEVVMFAVALAVAAIPEGMPAVVTLTLALGVQRMARHNALVRRLSAVESLGSVTVIATDKTGTLTENAMSVREVAAEDERGAMEAMVLANDADAATQVGDPLEVGLLEYARSRGVDVAAEHRAHPRVHVRPFDSAWRYMRVTVIGDAGLASYAKGAPEAVIARCDLPAEARAVWMERADAAAARGYRVLALARAPGEVDDGWTWLGLVMLWDPPRAEVPAALQMARRAGVRVLMITGDHPGTARAVAEAIGMESVEVVTGDALDRESDLELQATARRANVFARANPGHKLRLVEALQRDGNIVAMTGDGVNDSPALKRADVGVAMGKRGSDVAREVADLVLLDDDFATIVGAIEAGRGIYENIQSFIRFTFSTNVALIALVVTGAVVAYAERLRDSTGLLLVPLTALQLLWINFLGDGPPALALAVDRPPGLMDRPPRPARAGLLDAPSLWFILSTGAFKGAVGIALLVALPAVGYGVIATRTLLFLYESIGKLVSVYPARGAARRRRPNLALHAAVVGGIVLQVLTLVVPGLRAFLGLVPLGLRASAVLVGAVVATWAAAALAGRAVSGPGPGRWRWSTRASRPDPGSPSRKRDTGHPATTTEHRRRWGRR